MTEKNYNLREDLYDDENEPVVDETARVYHLALDRHRTGFRNWITVLISVDNYEMIHIDQGHWFGEKIDITNHTQMLEIYEWLVEWDYAEWKKIGPEDSELFATERLLAVKPKP
jgi:hypothetical protein